MFNLKLLFSRLLKFLLFLFIVFFYMLCLFYLFVNLCFAINCKNWNMLEYFLYFKLALEKNYVNTLLHNSLLNNVLSILRVYSENLIPHNLNNLKNFEYLVSDFSSIIKRTNTKVHPMVFITTWPLLQEIRIIIQTSFQISLLLDNALDLKPVKINNGLMTRSFSTLIGFFFTLMAILFFWLPLVAIKLISADVTKHWKSVFCNTKFLKSLGRRKKYNVFGPLVFVFVSLITGNFLLIVFAFVGLYGTILYFSFYLREDLNIYIDHYSLEKAFSKFKNDPESIYKIFVIIITNIVLIFFILVFLYIVTKSNVWCIYSADIKNILDIKKYSNETIKAMIVVFTTIIIVCVNSLIVLLLETFLYSILLIELCVKKLFE